VRRSGGEECRRKWVVVEALEKVVDDTRPPAVIVNAIEGLACGLRRQRGDHQAPTVLGNGRDSGSDADEDRFEPTQLIYQGIDLPSIRSLGIENGLAVVEDQKHFPRGEEWPQGYQILGIFDPTDDLREPGEEVGMRRWELIAADEPPVVVKPILDAIVMKNCESN
jgi:hypothetical protein